MRGNIKRIKKIKKIINRNYGSSQDLGFGENSFGGRASAESVVGGGADSTRGPPEPDEASEFLKIFKKFLRKLAYFQKALFSIFSKIFNKLWVIFRGFGRKHKWLEIL